MDFRKFPTILAVFLLTVLIVHPVLSADNTTLTDILSGPNVANVTSEHLENDAATSFYNNGVTLVDKGDYENAIKLFDQALASNTTLIRKTDAYLYTFQNKAYAQIQLGNYTDAIATVDAGLALFPNDAILWNSNDPLTIHESILRYIKLVVRCQHSCSITLTYTRIILPNTVFKTIH